MPWAYWCLLIAGLMPVLTIAIAKFGRRDYNNAAPRAWLEKQSGLRQRADYAHRNHFEAFPFFAAAVLTAQQLDAAQATINAAATVFVVARLFYTLFYLTNRATWRSLAWFAGYGAVVALFIIAAQAY